MSEQDRQQSASPENVNLNRKLAKKHKSSKNVEKWQAANCRENKMIFSNNDYALSTLSSNSKKSKRQVTLPELNESNSGSSPRTSRSSRLNKLYRCPPTPEHEQLFQREKSFVLDSVAVSKMQDDFFATNPKLGAVIFPYNAQKDRHCNTYFYQPTVPKVLKKTGQVNGGNAIAGIAQERFHGNGYLHRYFSARNQAGIGHSLENISAHHTPLITAQPMIGYNGQFGYRRNTPELRHAPSPFGIHSRGLPLY